MLLKLIVVVFLVSFMLEAGLHVDRNRLVEVLKEPWLLTRVFLANFIMVPIFADLIVRVFQLNDEIATGILLMAIAPGVPFLPLAAGRGKGGSTSFAVCLAFLMPALSIVTAPLTAQWLLPTGALAHLQTGSFVENLLIVQLIPLLIGVGIRSMWPNTAAALIKVFALVSVAMILILLIVLSPRIARAFATAYGTRGLMASLTLIALSAITGWLFGGSNPANRTTLSVATVLRNIALASLIANQNFPDSAVGPVALAYFVLQGIAGALIGTALKRSHAHDALHFQS